ncbi:MULTISPECIES: hypothetical protein [Streptomyces]|uniref:hypothetical protein n=1 Tax=Streptomyces TaxID=1883 RepID=UPI0029A19EF1|nr:MULTISPECIES: hypothetical protein [unclassified Streptomyces]MDX3609768.1 hypothetical protein [Streptomyces sp. FL06-04B]MDX3735103.1 hypothetical protein [Streptomyces sp. ID01-15D]
MGRELKPYGRRPTTAGEAGRDELSDVLLRFVGRAAATAGRGKDPVNESALPTTRATCCG